MKCFADTKKGCSALKVKECDGCNFFKTIEQVEDESSMTELRLKKIGRK